MQSQSLCPLSLNYNAHVVHFKVSSVVLLCPTSLWQNSIVQKILYVIRGSWDASPMNNQL